MKSVWKFPIGIQRMIQEIEVPKDAKILTVQVQNNGMPCIWAEVETENKPEYRLIAVFGTGNELFSGADGKLVYIGTIQIYDEVFHVYEVVMIQ